MLSEDKEIHLVVLTHLYPYFLQVLWIKAFVWELTNSLYKASLVDGCALTERKQEFVGRVIVGKLCFKKRFQFSQLMLLVVIATKRIFPVIIGQVAFLVRV